MTAVAQSEEVDFSASQALGISPQAQLNQPEYIAFLNKCTMVRDVTNTVAGKDIRVISCEDTYLYIGTAVDCLQISKCVNCVIFVSAVTRACSIDMCENVTVTVAAEYLRIGNCVDC